MPSRTRSVIALAGLVAALVCAPVLGAVAIAADEVVVRPGDTLTAIARRHQVTIERIVELNRLPDANRIVVGQRLRLSSDGPAGRAAPAAAPAAAAKATRHTVRAGEHLTGIARRYGTTIAAIAEANRLADPSRIYAGQELAIPGAPAAKPAAAVAKPAAPASTASAPKPSPARVHTVRTGEHLTGIARHYGMTIAAIAEANHLDDPSRIYAGQELTIPAAGGTAAGAAGPSAKAKPAMPADMAAGVAKRDAVRRVIIEEANRFRVPVALALAVAWQESGWQQGVVSSAGAVGVMQLLPATGEWVGEAMLGTTVDIHDLRGNVRAGVRLLAHYLDRYDGSQDLVLAAYYQGQTAADRHGVYAISRPYIASIKLLERIFGG